MGSINIRKRGKVYEYFFEGAKVNNKRTRIPKSGFRTKAEAYEEGRWYLGTTKTEGICREIYINETLYKALYNYKNNQNLLRKKLGKGNYAIKILRDGAEIRDVANILGHSSIETTENYYILSSKEAQKEANKILEDVIKSDIISKIIDYK